MRLERLSSSKASSLKWLGFVTAVWVEAIAGSNYTFSDYSNAMKRLMNLSQVQLNNLSVAKDVGKAFGLLAGFSSDRFPTWVLLLIGSVEGFIGYGAQCLVVSQIITPLPYWAMCIFVCMGGNSVAWFNTAVLVTCIRNFRRNRGPASGIPKAFVGLSAAIYTDLCDSLFSDNASPAFLLMLLTFVPPVVCLTAMIFLREVPPSRASSSLDQGDAEESNYFTVFTGVAVVLAFYLLAYDFVGSRGYTFNIAYSSVLMLLLASPLMIPAYIAFKGWLNSNDDPDHEYLDPLLADDVVADTQRTQEEAPVLLLEEGVAANIDGCFRKAQPALGEDHTIIEIFKTMEFWLLIISFVVGVGPGITVMNNMGQMGSALGYSDVSLFVSLLSVTGFFGRIASGSVSEYGIKKASTPRPVFNAVSQIVMALVFTVMGIAVPGSLYIGSCVVGFMYGVRITISIPVASELFGLKYYGIIYNILLMNLPIASFLFSGVLAGYLFDAEATTTSSGQNICYGAHCYRSCFLIFAGMCLVGFALDVWLSLRTRELYKKIGATKT